MENSLENEINQELKKEKFKIFYKNNKIKIIFIIIFLFFLIFVYQLRIFYIKKNNSENIEKILLSKNYLDEKNLKGVDILNKLKNSNDYTISIISTYQLIDFYLKEKNKKAVLDQINFLKKKLNNNKHALELLNIKDVLIQFDTIQEKEILALLNKTKNDKFTFIKNKLLYDFYTRDKQFKKAEQFIIK